jgi:retron-type reverse transcriptase
MSRMPILEQVANENNLRNAWIKVRYHARTSLEYFDKYAYDEFEENLDSNLAIIRIQLLRQEYKFGALRIFEIPKGDGVRKIYFLSPSDGVVSQAVLNVVAPTIEAQYSTSSFGNRISYATSESKNPFLDWQPQYTKYLRTYP